MAYFNINGDNVSDSDIERMYVDMLDDCYEVVQVGSLSYCMSHVLSSVDPVAYRIGLIEYTDGLIEDGELTEQ